MGLKPFLKLHLRRGNMTPEILSRKNSLELIALDLDTIALDLDPRVEQKEGNLRGRRVRRHSESDTQSSTSEAAQPVLDRPPTQYRLTESRASFTFGAILYSYMFMMLGVQLGRPTSEDLETTKFVTLSCLFVAFTVSQIGNHYLKIEPIKPKNQEAIPKPKDLPSGHNSLRETGI
jgi:hypothetical protein